MTFVLDASMALAWCFEDEAGPASDEILNRLKSDDAVVPSLWILEVANALVTAERRKRLTPAQNANFVSIIAALPIVIDEAVPAMNEHIALAREHSLSSYDAAYLSTCLRYGYPLATTDAALAAAAKAAKIKLLNR